MNPEIISYKQLRVAIGILAFSIVIGTALGGFLFSGIGVQRSISFYYYTNMADFLEGTLFITGIFLVTYYGYSILDRVINTIAGIFCMGIALFPCSNIGIVNIGIFQIPPSISNVLHGICAGVFFVLLAFISFFLFTKTGVEEMTPNKKIRNIIYRTTAIIIIVSAIILGIVGLTLSHQAIVQSRIIFILESIMLFSFGISWLVKGEALLTDN